METLLYLLRVIGTLPIIYALFSILNLIYNLIKKKVFRKEYGEFAIDLYVALCERVPVWFTLFAVLTLMSAVLTETTLQKMGVYDLELLPEGQYCFYVELERNDKTYTVPARIEISDEYKTYYDSHGREKEQKRTYYYIHNVYWSNGGYSTFENYEELDINHSVNIIDGREHEYSCTLLNEHAYTSQFEETQPPTKNYIIMLMESFCVIFCWVYSVKHRKPNPYM